MGRQSNGFRSLAPGNDILPLLCEEIFIFNYWTSCRYANIVGNSTLLLKRFKLKLARDFWQSKQTAVTSRHSHHEQLLGLRRKYSTIEISDAVDSHTILCEIFGKFGHHLRTLVISNSTLDDFTFLTILKCASFLEELCMSEVAIERKLPAINPISIVHLTSVTIHHTNWLVFKFLIRSQISSLQINNYLNEGEETRIHLVHMLSNQYRLSELSLYGTSFKTLFRNSDFNDIWNYQLSKFHVGCGFGKNSDAVDSNLMNFLIANSETLSDVEITIPNCEEVVAFTLLNLGNITSLTLDVGRLPKDHRFYATLANSEPNLQLKHLKLIGFFCQSAFVKVILNKYPAITNLELDDWSHTTTESNTLNFVSKKLPQLQQLFVPEISTKNADMLRFSALKQLNVSCIRDTPNLVNFLRKNSSIEIFKVGLVYMEQISSLSQFIDLAQVQHLSFTGSTKSLRMILDLVQRNTPKSLKTLELSLLSHENYSSFTNTMRKTIKINFPNNANDLSTKLDALL